MSKIFQNDEIKAAGENIFALLLNLPFEKGTLDNSRSLEQGADRK